jgi:hypothetical protein
VVEVGRKKKRVHSAGPANIDREVDLGPVRFALTDDQRSEISRLSGIPEDNPDAWAMIEVSIGLYRRRKVLWDHAMPPAQVRKELEDLSHECANLQERLRRLIDRGPLRYALSFTEELTSLRKLEAQFFLMAGDIEVGKTGPGTGDAYILVDMLDGIRREFTGRQITRSQKRTDSSRDYIKAVFRIADPEIGPGTIELAMKRSIARQTGTARQIGTPEFEVWINDGAKLVHPDTGREMTHEAFRAAFPNAKQFMLNIFAKGSENE